MKPSGRLELWLCDVRDLAEIELNGKPLGVVWKLPRSVDVTGTATAGRRFLFSAWTSVRWG